MCCVPAYGGNGLPTIKNPQPHVLLPGKDTFSEVNQLLCRPSGQLVDVVVVGVS